MKDIIALFRNSIADHVLEGRERKEIKNAILQLHPSPQNLNVLRSEIFKIAQEYASTIPASNLIDWIEAANKLTILPPKPNLNEARAFFSPGNDCKDAIIQQIENASESLYICVFTISDNDIASAILNAHKRKIDVRVISDDEKMHDVGSDIMWMTEKGIPTKIDNERGHMHHKFCIVDHTTIISGSYNWTKSAADRNYENIVIGANPKITKMYLTKFQQMWREFESLKPRPKLKH